MRVSPSQRDDARSRKHESEIRFKKIPLSLSLSLFSLLLSQTAKRQQESLAAFRFGRDQKNCGENAFYIFAEPCSPESSGDLPPFSSIKKQRGRRRSTRVLMDLLIRRRPGHRHNGVLQGYSVVGIKPIPEGHRRRFAEAGTFFLCGAARVLTVRTGSLPDRQFITSSRRLLHGEIAVPKRHKQRQKKCAV